MRKELKKDGLTRSEDDELLACPGRARGQDGLLLKVLQRLLVLRLHWPCAATHRGEDEQEHNKKLGESGQTLEGIPSAVKEDSDLHSLRAAAYHPSSQPPPLAAWASPCRGGSGPGTERASTAAGRLAPARAGGWRLTVGGWRAGEIERVRTVTAAASLPTCLAAVGFCCTMDLNCATSSKSCTGLMLPSTPSRASCAGPPTI